MRRRHPHADERRRAVAPVEATPLFAQPSAITEAQFFAKWLRGLAAYHREHDGRIEVSADFMHRLKSLGISLEFPVSGTIGHMTPDEATRYADTLDPRSGEAA